MNYIPAVILSEFGRRQQFILALVSVEFVYFEGEYYCFLCLGRQGLKQNLAYTRRLGLHGSYIKKVKVSGNAMCDAIPLASFAKNKVNIATGRIAKQAYVKVEEVVARNVRVTIS